MDVGHIALGTIAHKDVIGIHLDTARGVFATDNGLAHKVIPLLGTVTSECALLCHLVHSLVHGLDDLGDKRRGHIADSKTDDVGVGVGALVFLDFLGDGREQVTTGKKVVIGVYN